MLAARLARLDKGRPRQASFRRSISTARYAPVHACTAALIGWGRPWSTTTPLLRAFDHGAAKRSSSQLRFRKDVDADLRTFAETFPDLQEARLKADDDPGARFARDEASEFAAQAAVAIRILRALPADARLDLAARLISKQR